MFKVNQKVVCVDDDFSFFRDCGERYPKRARTYTVRNFHSDGAHIRLAEIVNAPLHYSDGFCEVSFRITRFRPIVERKTDISIFTEILRRESAPSSLPLAEA